VLLFYDNGGLIDVTDTDSIQKILNHLAAQPPPIESATAFQKTRSVINPPARKPADQHRDKQQALCLTIF
jgi:hypothetical protein